MVDLEFPIDIQSAPRWVQKSYARGYNQAMVEGGLNPDTAGRESLIHDWILPPIPTTNRSYFTECERDEHGRCLPEGASGSRSQLAKRSYKPSDVKKQRLGESEQRRMASMVGLQNTDDNKPFDLVGKHDAVEVKTLVDNDNDKITVHPDSRIRKEQFAKQHGLRSHTVAIDIRGSKRVYYYRSGVGAYRLSAMERVSVQQLKERLS